MGKHHRRPNGSKNERHIYRCHQRNPRVGAGRRHFVYAVECSLWNLETNCVWFKFDVQFNSNGSVEWWIWDVLGQATNSSDYDCQAIGIPYVAADAYSFQLTTSDVSTVTFSIQDTTSGVSWSTSNWQWTVPSLSLLYDTNCYSPASAVEGYTTNSQLNDVPYFQTYISFPSSTANWNLITGQMPSGISTQTSGDDMWYMMGNYASTTVTLLPANGSTPLSPSNDIKIWSTYGGQPETNFIQTNQGLSFQTDIGSNVVIQGGSNQSTSSEEWVLNSQGTNVTVASWIKFNVVLL